MTRPDWDEYFLLLASIVALRADCRRRQCGAVIVKDNRIVSTGYNGSPAGDDRSCLGGDCPRGLREYDDHPGHELGNSSYSDCISLHSEMNAIAYADCAACEGATIYLNGVPPCDMCSKLISAAGIARIVWRRDA